MNGGGYPPQVIIVRQSRRRKNKKRSLKLYKPAYRPMLTLKQIKGTYRTAQSTKRFLFPSTSHKVKRMEAKIKEIKNRRRLKQLQEAHKAMKETEKIQRQKPRESIYKEKGFFSKLLRR